MSSVPNRSPNLLAAAGAIVPVGSDSLFHITAVSAAAFTLAANQIDEQRITVIDETGHAHTIAVALTGSPATAGLNGGGLTLITFGGAKGNSVDLVGRGGSWFAVNKNGVSLS